MRVRTLVVAALWVVVASLVYADVLWDKAEQGASVEEIAKLYPVGQRITPNVDQRTPSGAGLGYEVKNVSAFGMDYLAKFYFLDGALNSVDLGYESKESTRICKLKHQKIRESLESEHGVGKTGSGNTVKSMYLTEWKLKGKTISLLMATFGDGHCNISINHWPGLKEPEVVGTKGHDNVCESASEVAGSIMGARQSGAQMAKVMKVGGGDQLFREMVVEAYEVPHYSTEQMKQRAIGDFQNKHYLACTKELMKR